jgi:hypothetical protein
MTAVSEINILPTINLLFWAIFKSKLPELAVAKLYPYIRYQALTPSPR